MRRIVSTLAVLGLSALLVGCGAGSRVSDQLVTFRAGSKWVYSVVNGTVTLNGATQNLQSTSNGGKASTFTMTVESATSKDANNQTVNILDRVFDLFTLDGREIKANFRLYFTQTKLGIFVHGVNNYIGSTANSANDVFVPSTATPAFEFLYLPNPLADGYQITDPNPLALSPTGNPPPSVSYTLQVGTGRAIANVPAGSFSAKGVTITENFNQSLVFGTTASPAAFTPDTGLIVAPLTATLPDGTQVAGTIELTSVTL